MANSIEEQLINLQTFKKYIASNVVDDTKIYDNNLNINNFMGSLEAFSSQTSEMDSKKKQPNNNKMLVDDDKNDLNEEKEIEKLLKFL